MAPLEVEELVEFEVLEEGLKEGEVGGVHVVSALGSRSHFVCSWFWLVGGFGWWFWLDLPGVVFEELVGPSLSFRECWL